MTEARMQETTEFKPGTFCWIELGTADSDAAKKFYTELFGWTYEDNPMGPDMVYTMLKLDGREVGALYQQSAEMKSQGIPPNWMSYVLVTSADESSEKAKELGGTLINGPFDVETFGRMSVIQDPTGGVFSLWQAGTHKGACVVNIPNSFCWNELATGDTEKAGNFYSGLFGWGKDVKQMGPFTYNTFMNADRPAGGMYAPTPEMGDIPTHWLVYIAVDDTDAMVAKATELGAKVFAPPMDIPGTGRFAVIQDPQGAALGIIKLEMP